MTRPFHPEQLQPGDAIRHYRVVRRLGRGGSAIAFLVEHEGQLYTLKMAAHAPKDDDEAREDERAWREAVTLGHFRHPNLLAVHETGRWPDLTRGHFFLVTDYVPGSTFNEWRWRTQAPLRRLVGVLGEVVLAVAELHERGVCHRDIKADNILVRDGDERPFLIDFGAAYLPGAYTLTRALPPVTFHNMAPEAAAFLRSGEWEQGAHLPARPSADLYALGALFYEALTDCHPFNPRLPPEKLLLAIELLPPAEPVRLDPRVPPGLNALVMRLLAKDPEHRPPSARAVHEELMRLLETEEDTENWTAPYAFPTTQDGEGAALPSEPQAAPPASREREVPDTVEEAGRAREEQGARRSLKGCGWVLAMLALVLLLLGVGWESIRAGCASALEAACSSEASTALALPAPSEKGRDLLLSSTRSFLGGFHALLCAVSAQLLACVSAPVRPDSGGFLEQCPPEALMTASRLGFDKKPFTLVDLTTGTDVSTGNVVGVPNFRSGPMEGWMELPDGSLHRVAGEATVFSDRVYVRFDRIFLDASHPVPGRVPSPICGVVVGDLDRTEFGQVTYAARQDPGVEIDPSKVVYRGSDAAILNFSTVHTYVQAPGHRFPK